MSLGKIHRFVLKNGLTVVVERKNQTRSVSIGVWVKVGSAHEKLQHAGISHFLEHMVFKGTTTKTAKEISATIDRVGGELNAFTARECTCFHVLLLDQHFELGLSTLSDILLNSEFDPDELERERKVILQEIAMVEENPEELAYDLFFKKLFPVSRKNFAILNLGMPILGSVSSIRRLSRGQLIKYFRTHYQPKNIVISIAGRVSTQKVKKLVQKYLGKKHWPGRVNKKSQKRLSVSPEVVKTAKKFFHWEKRGFEQAHVFWSVEGPAYGSKDQLMAQLLALHLGGGMSSLLFQEIREKQGLAYTVYALMTPFVSTGVFNVYAAVPPLKVKKVLDVIENVTTRLKNELLPRDELESLKQNFIGNLFLSSENSDARMIALGKSELFYKKQISLDEICEKVNAVSSQELRRVARKLFRGDRAQRAVFILGPKEGLKKWGMNAVFAK